jgi:hypothetical protein
MAAEISPISSNDGVYSSYPSILQDACELPIYSPEILQRYLVTNPLPPSGSFIVHRMADPHILFAVTRIIHDAPSAEPFQIFTETFGYDPIHHKICLSHFVHGAWRSAGPSFNNLDEVKRSYHPSNEIPPEIRQRIYERHDELARSEIITSWDKQEEYLQRIKEAPPGVFFITGNPQISTFAIFWKSRATAVQSTSVTISCDGTLFLKNRGFNYGPFPDFSSVCRFLSIECPLCRWHPTHVRPYSEPMEPTGLEHFRALPLHCDARPTPLHGKIPTETLEKLERKESD